MSTSRDTCAWIRQREGTWTADVCGNGQSDSVRISRDKREEDDKHLKRGVKECRVISLRDCRKIS